MCPEGENCSTPGPSTAAPRQQSGETSSSMPPAVIGAIVAGLLVALLLCAVVVIVVIVCIVLRKKRLTKCKCHLLRSTTLVKAVTIRVTLFLMILDSTDSNKAPKRGGTSIRRLMSTSSRAPATTGPHREDDIHLSPNPVYSIHSTNLLHREHRPPTSGLRNTALHSEDAIQLSPNPVYATQSSAPGAECSLQHSPSQESSNSSGQGNQTPSHSGDTIQMLPNLLYAIHSKDSSTLQDGPLSSVLTSQGNTSTTPHSDDPIQLLPNPVYSIHSTGSRHLPQETMSGTLSPPGHKAREEEETGVYSYAYYTTIQ